MYLLLKTGNTNTIGMAWYILLSLSEEKIDLANTDLWSLPVKKLKKILTQWGEQCRGCVEKGDLIAKINTLKESRVELWGRPSHNLH